MARTLNPPATLDDGSQSVVGALFKGIWIDATTGGGGSTALGMTIGQTGYKVPVGIRSHVAYDNSISGTNITITYRFFVPLVDSTVTTVLPVFGNQFVGTAGGAPDVQASNDITIAAAVENGATIVPFTFNGGATTAVVAAAGTAVVIPDAPKSFGSQVTTNDKYGVPIARSGFWMRTYVSITGTGIIPLNLGPLANADALTTTSGANLTTAGSGTVSGGSGSFMYGPTMVLGPSSSATKIVGVASDSIFDGYSDDFHSSYWGPVARAALDQGFPFVKLSRGGETASAFANASTRFLRHPYTAGVTHWIVEYGTNDQALSSTAGVTQVKDRLSSIAYYLQSQTPGAKVYVATVPPRTSSTDAWATTANQTPLSGSQVTYLAALNQWIRSAPTPFAGVIDLEGACSSAQDSGLWAAGATSDGVHPSDTLMRGAITTSVKNATAAFA